MLRHDTRACLGKALFPAAITILAGIDLVAKFYEGSDQGAVGARFKRFVAMYSPTSPEEATVLYHLRNALLHSFGLYSAHWKRAKRAPPTLEAEYWFILHAGPSGTGSIVERHGGRYFVGIQTLHAWFESALESYRRELADNPDLQSKFMRMWPKYGYIQQRSTMP